jgi:type II secretory pathway pseudopilin PulG
MLLTGKKKKNEGFLLLEIIISVSILSFGIILILNSFMRPIKASQISMDFFNAGLLLEEKMIELYSGDIKEGPSRGEFSGFDNRFSWDLDVIKLEDISYREVNLKVFWKEKDKEQDISISTYI